MPEVEIDPADSGRVIIYVNHLEADLMQAMPGARHDRKRSKPEQTIYTAPLSWGTCVALRGFFPGDELQIGPELSLWAEKERSERIEPCMRIRQALDAGGQWDPRLRSFQRAGVGFLGMAERAVLGDDMGTGKTVQLIMTLRWLAEHGHQVFPVCVITTSSTKIPWQTHWLEWWPFAMPFVIDGTPAKRRKQFELAQKHIEAGDPVVCIINWEAVRLHSRLAPYGNYKLKACRSCGGHEDVSASTCEKHRKELNEIAWRSVIADEIHKMADPKSKQTRATWAVQHQESVRYSYGASGTIGEDPGRVWAPLHGVAPLDYPTRTEYVDRYCLRTWTPYGEWKIIGLQPSTREEFFRTFNTRFRRIPIALAAPLLPPVVRSTREAPMGTAQARAYKEMKEKGHILGDTAEESIITSRNLEKETRLLQLAAGTCVVEAGKVVLATPSSKLDVFEEILEEVGHGSFVACAIHRQLVMLAAKVLDDAGVLYRLIVGGMSAIEREANLQDFQQQRVQALLFTMGAGGTGLNMTTASTMIRLQRSWSLIENLQTERRFWRIGSERHDVLNLVDIVVPGTSEVRQFRTVKQKLARLEQINQDLAVIMSNGGLDQARLIALQAEQQSIMAADDLTQEGYDDDDDL